MGVENTLIRPPVCGRSAAIDAAGVSPVPPSPGSGTNGFPVVGEVVIMGPKRFGADFCLKSRRRRTPNITPVKNQSQNTNFSLNLVNTQKLRVIWGSRRQSSSFRRDASVEQPLCVVLWPFSSDAFFWRILTRETSFVKWIRPLNRAEKRASASPWVFQEKNSQRASRKSFHVISKG